MNDDADESRSPGPSAKALGRGALWTFLGALLVTVLFVLPAEYGVDPTGIGAKVGLTRTGVAAAPESGTAPRIVAGTFPGIPAAEDFDFYEPEVLGDPYTRSREQPVRSHRLVIPLDVSEQVEVKATMKQGNALIYSWKLIDGDTVYADFHADPQQAELYPDQYWIRYLESEKGSASGSLVAPFDGNHGWYWLNIEDHPVSIELEVHGFYETLDEIMRSYQ